jgi:hypothetical protein
MKKQHAASFAEGALNSQASKARTLVRYLGFEVVEGHRRLNFSVKPFGVQPLDVTIRIPDSALTGRFRISVQDAVPIAYDKLVRLSNSDGGCHAEDMSLTDEDIAQYRKFHGVETKRVNDSMLERWRRSGFAA